MHKLSLKNVINLYINKNADIPGQTGIDVKVEPDKKEWFKNKIIGDTLVFTQLPDTEEMKKSFFVRFFDHKKKDPALKNISQVALKDSRDVLLFQNAANTAKAKVDAIKKDDIGGRFYNMLKLKTSNFNNFFLIKLL